MNRRIAVIGALLRKDLQSLWPLAALVAGLQLLVLLQGLTQTGIPPRMLATLMSMHSIATLIAIAVLAVAVIQQDAVAGVREDWLTRPIASIELLSAKVLFILLTTVPATVIAQTLLGMSWDLPLLEALQRATALDNSKPWVVGAAVVAAVLTGSFLQAAGLALAVFASVILLMTASTLVVPFNEAIMGSGSQWMLLIPLQAAAVATAIYVVWRQYSRRTTRTNLIVLMAFATLVAAAPLYVRWSPMAAAQQALSTEPGSSEPVGAELRPGCFSAMAVSPGADLATNASLRVAPTRLDPAMWTAEERRTAGEGAVMFATTLQFPGVPAGSSLKMSMLSARYESDGQTLLQLYPRRIAPYWSGLDGARTATHFWLLPRAEYERISKHRAARLEVTAWLSLLKQGSSVEIEADGSRRFIEGMGYCGAVADATSRTIKLDCFKRGPAPAFLTAAVVGTATGSSQLHVQKGGLASHAVQLPDYTPAWLELLASNRSSAVLNYEPGTQTPKVLLTALEAQSHFSRTATAAGVLGHSHAACPPPSAVAAATAPASTRMQVMSEGKALQVRTDEIVVHSERIGRDFLVEITYPDRVEPGRKYSALYAVDAGFGVAGPASHLLIAGQKTAPFFTVAIGYPNEAGRYIGHRNTDLVHRRVELNGRMTGGGGEAFETFILEELRPFLEARYPLDPHRAVLFGHSGGGLFTATVLVRKPAAFSAYLIGSLPLIAQSPLREQAREVAPRGEGRRVFIGMAPGDIPTMHSDEFAAPLSSPDSTFKVRQEIFAGETHNSVYLMLLSKGLPFVLPTSAGELTAVRADPQSIERVTGSYRLEDGTVATFTRRGDRLTGRLGDGAEVALEAASERQFFSVEYNSVVTFDAGPARAQTATLRTREVDRSLQRIERSETTHLRSTACNTGAGCSADARLKM